MWVPRVGAGVLASSQTNIGTVQYRYGTGPYSTTWDSRIHISHSPLQYCKRTCSRNALLEMRTLSRTGPAHMLDSSRPRDAGSTYKVCILRIITLYAHAQLSCIISARPRSTSRRPLCVDRTHEHFIVHVHEVPLSRPMRDGSTATPLLGGAQRGLENSVGQRSERGARGGTDPARPTQEPGLHISTEHIACITRSTSTAPPRMLRNRACSRRCVGARGVSLYGCLCPLARGASIHLTTDRSRRPRRQRHIACV